MEKRNSSTSISGRNIDQTEETTPDRFHEDLSVDDTVKHLRTDKNAIGILDDKINEGLQTMHETGDCGMLRFWIAVRSKL